MKKKTNKKKKLRKASNNFFKYSPFSESLSTLDKSFDYSEYNNKKNGDLCCTPAFFPMFTSLFCYILTFGLF